MVACGLDVSIGLSQECVIVYMLSDHVMIFFYA